MPDTRILLTGATGFLGSNVLLNLLSHHPAADVLILVRAATPIAGLARVREVLHTLDAPDALLERLHTGQILPGTLADVAAFAADPRLDTVTHVINCAAVASFGNNPSIWPINVDGTFAFAERMAQVTGLKRFLHVGTAMACGPTAVSPVQEGWQFAARDAHLVPYTASKAAIELRLRTQLPELPLIVARPSIVVGHTRLGCKPSGSIFWVFRMAHKLGYFTCDLDEKIDVIPADYCAQALLLLALKPELENDLYHISADRESCSFGEIDSALASALNIEPIAARYRRIACADLTEHTDDLAAAIGPCNPRLVLRALRLYGGFAELNFVFSNARLRREGMAAAPRFTSYIDVCARTSEPFTIGQQMAWDFK